MILTQVLRWAPTTAYNRVWNGMIVRKHRMDLDSDVVDQMLTFRHSSVIVLTPGYHTRFSALDHLNRSLNDSELSDL